MMQKIFNTIKAFRLLLSQVMVFSPEDVFKDKRVAVIGAADTAFEEENGNYIDSFDIVVRVNKALVSWQPEQEKFIGKRTDVLFHSFYENDSSVGGPINPERFKRFNLQYLVHPTNSPKGYRVHLSYYKRHPYRHKTFLLSRQMYRKIDGEFQGIVPTTGFFAMMAALNSPCRELYVSGFTFFRTPYSPGYRDHLLDKRTNEEHIKKQGLHDPELELKLFQRHLKNSPCKKVILDPGLSSILQTQES